MHPSSRFQHNNKKPFVRINNAIRAREVLVIDSTGKSLGVLPIHEAQQRAQQQGLDLVEVSPHANPPVCKILDYGKYKYSLSKKEKDSKKGATKLKEIQLHVNINEHDFLIKLKQAESFMAKGMKVKFNLFLRGREITHQDLALNLMKRLIQDLAHIGQTDQEPKLTGRNISLTFIPLPANKRLLKYNLSEVEANKQKPQEEKDKTEKS
ncbi:translation initiation factor IF-3 [Methylacidiphilum kamchatkense Kam1]|uniref:Translation initiation factor IF-3 n=1 Tax=Methylacidiphilum kamchatkense Kam1 TaxID=1202785 RepID=A0A0C1RSZ5_9BACT|nr:translation initiation factor IF-3 [Methylacidiphilum kamchatkense]KIE58091.1 translation initiation factor IF-3 [Methylacidiphilum kamchatkense Kam1]QDQ41593.1 translation initiation factor IF-3 [Methylacidiphilum kamchatkense Kam1]